MALLIQALKSSTGANNEITPTLSELVSASVNQTKAQKMTSLEDDPPPNSPMGGNVVTNCKY